MGVGICLSEMEKWFEALHFLKKATSLSDNNSYHWLALADAEANVGNLISAMEAYQLAAEYDDTNLEAWVKWSVLNHEQGDFDAAANIVMSAMEQMPEEAELYYRASIYLIKAGKYQEAFNYLETGLTINYDVHEIMFEYFPDLEAQKAIYRIIDQYKNKLD